ncbi:protein arginine kinase [Niallia sp. Sow4_A1]|uniref:Protein-arginine kinase n=1 Tax=Niallia hominis TaxID=3133173 RepID=A0ABV1EWW6_9BACI|nr:MULTISPECIES: protein arginine kinase [Bacillaceae]MCM3363037.1 protein arginine kinase [Niallia sp. MER TA 168]CAI9387327.1 Protein-arginine kinase [Bacillus sp. T2.9-1]
MSLEKFISKARTSWMSSEGPDSEIVLTSRIRLARNIQNVNFPLLFSKEEADNVIQQVEDSLLKQFNQELELLAMSELNTLEKRVLVEKHLISPQLADQSPNGAVILSEDEELSIMINEEDHIRIQCIKPGLQIDEAFKEADSMDDLIEKKINYAYHTEMGYLTSCPTNIGTGLRASVMMHLPGMVLTQQMSRIIPAIQQLGLVVRGIYGEGSEALGNIFQISNQITLGRSEKDIMEELKSVVMQLIEQEKGARNALAQTSNIQLEDRVFRSYGILCNSRIMETKEAAKCLSDVRLGIDMGYIKNISKSILNELMILTQPGFLQLYAGEQMNPTDRDIRRASLIRERLKLETE